MEDFIWTMGWLIYDILTLWLAMLGVIFLFDCFASWRSRQRRESFAQLCGMSACFTGFALAAGSLDYYILTPALGTGINFFWS